MTSLELQLKRLKVPESQVLAVERDRSSLLFDAKEAAGLGRKDFYNIGQKGLAQLKKFDNDIDSYERGLWEKSSLNFNRTMVDKEENSELNDSLARMITRLAPYFHHHACKQVLEWLIYKYQIHRFNAEILFLAYLPYHASNSFGRMLSILKFTKPEFHFLDEFCKTGSPVPMNVLIRVCHANNSHFLIPMLSSFLVNAIQTVGDDYCEKRMHASYTFFAGFMVNLLDDVSKVNNQLIARIMPYVGIALKSKILPFKYAGMVVAAQLVTVTSLAPEVLANILKLLLLKMRGTWVDVALDTVILICQTQKVSELPRKAILKLVRKREELNLVPKLHKLMMDYDVTAFMVNFWDTLLDALFKESDKEQLSGIMEVLTQTLNLEGMVEEQAVGLFNSLLSYMESDPERSEPLPQVLSQHIRAIVIRFSTAFDIVRAKWSVRDQSIVDRFLKECHIEAYELIPELPGADLYQVLRCSDAQNL
ncbi:u3 small nucleolar RNA-associated protein 10 domain-containing protein [Ditylenchus destructor]|uniref:HEAT repeat-containing protein 1 n=1 Tax=Ditylenchus destructor TaxID=166010 RepID=A0AAD4NG70_9BILA|nr:u3 small nucleolar RNA-associated protein 10 domain-containing protein [Ditylenchus destructor]